MRCACPRLDPGSWAIAVFTGTVSSNFTVITYLIHPSALRAPVRAFCSRTKGVHRTHFHKGSTLPNVIVS